MPHSATKISSVVVIVISHNGCSDLDDCLNSLQQTVTNDVELQIVVVDNNSTDGTRELLGSKYCTVQTLLLPQNVGYGGGANAGWRYLHDANWEVDYVCVLNQDIVVDAGWLTPLIDAFCANLQAAIVQPQILLKQHPELVNTIGLRCHYLGFSYIVGFGSPKLSGSVLPSEIDAASGAAVMLRCSMFEESDGVFAEDLFMYLEDVELSWVARCRGYSCFAVPASRVYHSFESDAFLRNYFLMERNRWVLILTHYPLLLLVLAGPALAVMEITLCVWAALHGVLADRARVYWCLLEPKYLIQVFRRRSRAKRNQEILRPEMILCFAGRVDTVQLTDCSTTRMANALFAAYWCIARTFYARISDSLNWFIDK